MSAQVTNGIDATLTELDGGLYDISIDSFGDIATADSFDTAILVSLLSDRRADASEVAQSERRRGWIGNESTPGQEMGSKLWLYEQSRATRTVLNAIAGVARDALEWLVEDDFAVALSDVEVAVTPTGMTLAITIRRPNSQVDRRFFTLWDCTGS